MAAQPDLAAFDSQMMLNAAFDVQMQGPYMAFMFRF